jgi:hypothetical protein
MADFQTSEIDAKFAPVSVGAWRVKFDIHGNHTILVWQLITLQQYCLTTATMVVNVIMENKVRSLPLVNNETNTVLPDNVRKVGELDNISKNFLFPK